MTQLIVGLTEMFLNEIEGYLIQLLFSAAHSLISIFAIISHLVVNLGFVFHLRLDWIVSTFLLFRYFLFLVIHSSVSYPNSVY